MTGKETAFGIAMMILVLCLAVGTIAIPILEDAMRRRIARALDLPVNDNEPREADRV